MSSEEQSSFMSSLGLQVSNGLTHTLDSTPWVNPFFVQHSYGVTSRKNVDGESTSLTKIVVADIYGKKVSDGINGSLYEEDDVHKIQNSNRDQQMKENFLIVPLTCSPRRLAMNIALIPDAKFVKPGQYFKNYSSRKISSSKPTSAWTLKSLLRAQKHLLDGSKKTTSIAVDKPLRNVVTEEVSVENIVASRTRGGGISKILEINAAAEVISLKKNKAKINKSGLSSALKRKVSTVLRNGNRLISPPQSINVDSSDVKSTEVTSDPIKDRSRITAIRGIKLCKVMLPPCDVLKSCPACGLKVHTMLIKAKAIKFNECCLSSIV